MADHGKLFSAPMVLALLAGSKTQTRRLLTEARVFATPETKAFTLRDDDLARALQNASGFRRLESNGWIWESDAFEWQAPALRTHWMAHIGYAPADRLWVRETWCADAGFDHIAPRDLDVGTPYRLAADGVWINPYEIDEIEPGKLRASMHMPRWASRLTLPVTEARVQRLHDITEDDALAEGIVPHPRGGFWVPGVEHPNPNFPYLARPTAREMYAALWDVINGSGAWLANPWVTATSFDVHQQNIDAMEAAHG